MPIKSASFTFAAALLVAACASEPPATATKTARQGLADDDPLNGPGRQFINYGMMMFDWIYKISQIYEPTLSTHDLLALRAKVGELEGDVAVLREMATALARFVNAVAAEDRNRDVAEGYAAIKTGLDIVADQESRAEDGADMALLAANTLVADNFYMFEHFGGTKRFDPRMTTPTFIGAVTTWLALRERGSIKMNSPMDERLREFAWRLEWVVENSRASVSCSAVKAELELPCGKPDSGCVKYACLTHNECWDSVVEQWSYFDRTRTEGRCSNTYHVPNPDKELMVEQSRYAADTNAAVAAAWRRYADAPNTNLALGQPAFQWPDGGAGGAGRAVDGRTDGNWDAGSVSHTDSATGPWWWVDLGSVQHVREIRLFNRTDCCASRLSHYQVHVSADSTDGWDGTWAPVVDNSWLTIDDGDGSPLVHPVDVWTRWVAITKTDEDILSLAEVQVMGD
jgi:quinol monooxygenase YgiN